jgi:hypothetical protein
MTHAELRDRMRLYANVDANRLPNSACTDFLNASKDELMEAYRFRFGEAFITTAVVANSQTINPAPSNGHVRYPTKMWYLNNDGNQVEVFNVSWQEYLTKWGSASSETNGTGDAGEFAIYGENDDGDPTFYLGPIPDTDRTVWLTARITFDDLVGDDDHNQLTDRAPLALVYRALVMAADFLENPDRAPNWDAEFQKQLKRLAISHEGARYSARNSHQMQEMG